LRVCFFVLHNPAAISLITTYYVIIKMFDYKLDTNLDLVLFLNDKRLR